VTPPNQYSPQHKTTHDKIFDNLPVGVWEEDWSEVKLQLDKYIANNDLDVGEYLSSNPDLVKELSKTIIIIRINQRVLENYGAQTTEELGDFIVSETSHHEKFIGIATNLYNKNTEFILEGWESTLQGSPVYLKDTISTNINSIDTWNHIVVVSEDITEKVNNAVKLHKSEERIKALYKSLPVGIWEEDWSELKSTINELPINTQHNISGHLKENPELVRIYSDKIKILSVNPVVLEMYGYETSEYDEFINTYNAYKTGFIPELQAFINGASVYIDHTKEINRESERIDFRDSYYIPEEYKDSWDSVICISQIMTDEIEQEGIIKEQHRFLDMAADISKIGFWKSTIGDNPEIEYSGNFINNFMSSLTTKINNGKTELSNINKFIHPEDSKRVLETFRSSDKELKDYSTEYRIITPSGSIKYIREIGVINPPTEKQPAFHHGTLQDITDQVKQQNEIDKSRRSINLLKEQFFSAVNSINEGIALYDEYGFLVKSNSYFGHYFKTINNSLDTEKLSLKDLLQEFIKSVYPHNKIENTTKLFNDWLLGESNLDFEIFDGNNWFTLHKKLQSNRACTITLFKITGLKVRENTLTERKDQLEKISITDNLTNIYNRRKFDEKLDQDYNHSMLNNSTLSLILCDIDEFKKYNDHYGHVKGDQCLTQVAFCINKAFPREMDTVARYGGEEFAIILPNTSHEAAIALANKACDNVRKEEIPHEASTTTSIVTLSLGVTTIKSPLKLDQTSIIVAADKALYMAKESGRNRVCSYIEE